MVEISIKKRYNIKGSSRCEPHAGIAQLVEHFTRNEGVVSSSLISGLIKTQFRFFGTAFFYGARRVPESVFRRFMWLRFPVEN